MGVSERECLDGNVFKECLKNSVIKEVSLREWVSKLDETPSQHNLFIVNMTFVICLHVVMVRWSLQRRKIT